MRRSRDSPTLLTLSARNCVASGYAVSSHRASFCPGNDSQASDAHRHPQADGHRDVDDASAHPAPRQPGAGRRRDVAGPPARGSAAFRDPRRRRQRRHVGRRIAPVPRRPHPAHSDRRRSGDPHESRERHHPNRPRPPIPTAAPSPPHQHPPPSHQTDPPPTPSLRRTAPTPPHPCDRRHSGFDGGGCAGVDDQGREADCRGRRDRGGDVHVDGCLVAADPDRRALRDGPHHEFANRGEGLASRRRAGAGPGGVRTGELHGHRRQAPQRDGRDQHEGGEGRGDLRSRRPAIPQPASLRAFSMM